MLRQTGRVKKEELTAAAITVSTVNETNTSFLKTASFFKLQPDGLTD